MKSSVPSPLMSPEATRTPPLKVGPNGVALASSEPSAALNSRISPPPGPVPASTAFTVS